MPRIGRKVPSVGRHRVASKRRTNPVVLAAVVAPAAVLFAVGSDVQPAAGSREVEPPVQVASVQVAAVPVKRVAPCCFEIVSASPAAVSSADGPSATKSLVSASRWRVDTRPLLLPAGDAPEQGLQVKTILVSRLISELFPEIHSIGGVRPDGLRWHPDGLALDVVVPNPSSAEGIELGNEIVSYVLKNSKRLGIQDAIWRGTYYTPAGAQNSGAGHYDHVHITTLGGGYPTGGELYYR
jgi:hypothetical protein